MTPDEWAEVFTAGWRDADALHGSDFDGNAMASVLQAMAAKCQEIAQRKQNNNPS